ncbi:hypothetical protein [Aurantimicrobium minutum]|uniref:hypothetical protein n=1 Tax=Aurantimicrobium minutum TaxID=708131 RepID=UPI002475C7C6|nr:hypothetical protein [Aurantimicrobium minutum]MDH6423403.1 hypothetical protein [Aurantimicrobium minutum]
MKDEQESVNSAVELEIDDESLAVAAGGNRNILDQPSSMNITYNSIVYINVVLGPGPDGTVSV